MRIVYQLRTLSNEIVFTSTDHSVRKSDDLSPNYYLTEGAIPKNLLSLKKYKLIIWAGNPGVNKYINEVETINFSVIGSGNHGSNYQDYKHWPGIISPKIDWKIEKMEGYNG